MIEGSMEHLSECLSYLRLARKAAFEFAETAAFRARGRLTVMAKLHNPICALIGEARSMGRHRLPNWEAEEVRDGN